MCDHGHHRPPMLKPDERPPVDLRPLAFTMLISFELIGFWSTLAVAGWILAYCVGSLWCFFVIPWPWGVLPAVVGWKPFIWVYWRIPIARRW